MNKMTKQSRSIIYLSIFLAGAVVLSVILLMIYTPNRKPLATGLIISVLALAIFSVIVVVYQRRRKGASKLLEQEYYEAYEHIGDALAASPMSMLERKEVQNDVLVLLIDAQNHGRNVQDVTGGSVTQFIERIQESFGYRNQVLFHLLNGIQYMVSYLFALQFYMWQKEPSVGFFGAKLDVSMLLLLIPTAFIAVPLIRLFIKKQKMFPVLLIPIGVLGLFILFSELSYANWMHVPWIYHLMEGQYHFMTNGWFMALWLGAAVLAGLLKFLQRRASIKRL